MNFNPLGGSWTLVALLLAAIAGVVLFIAPRTRGLSTTRRRVEMGLRLLALPLFAILLTRPSISFVVVETLPATVTLLCDLSESMSIADGDGSGLSRYDAMRAAFKDAQPVLKGLCEEFDVHVVGFGETTEELTVTDGVVAFPEAPTGRETRLGEVLEDELRKTTGKRLLSVAALSDGSQRSWDLEATTPQDAALRYRDAERPINVVPFGSRSGSAAIRDLAIAELRANERVFIGNQFTVSGQLRAVGFAEREIPVNFEFETSPVETTVVGTTTLTPNSDDATIPWSFTYKPTTAGEWKLRVSTPVQTNELLDANNELSGFVKAVDGGVKALYIEGTRRYEQNFLRAALDSYSDVLVQYWRPPTSALISKFPDRTEAELVSTLANSRNSLVEPFFSEGKYATYILGDVDATAFQPEELEALAKLVEGGAGLVALAGERSLSLGGYASTPLADLLPVETLEAARVPLDADLSDYESATSESQRSRIVGDFIATPTEDALASRDAFAIDLNVDAKKNLEIWRATPPLKDVYRVGRVKRNATTLLAARQVGSSSAPSYPLLITQRYGLGRVAVVATDSTWRWRMRGQEETHAKFWRQLLLWSARSDEALEGELLVEPENPRLAPEEPAEFSVVYRPKEGENVDEVRAEASIVGPDGTRENVTLAREGNIWRGSGGATSALGDYRIEAALISASGETLQTGRSRFLVSEKNLELERPGAAIEVLEALAATTQGSVIEPTEFKSYLEELLKERGKIVDAHEERITLYDTWPVLIAFVLLMTADWILRRRWGMV